MGNGPAQKGTNLVKQLAAIDQLLIAGIKQGPVKKKDAINKVLQFAPRWTRRDCWQRIRQLRKVSERAGFATGQAGASAAPKESPVQLGSLKPWRVEDDDKLLNLAGYEPVKKIAQRLGRSERAVRFRLAALGMSARVTDGFSQRALRKMLRVSATKLRYLVGHGMLRVRDQRISARIAGILLRQAACLPGLLYYELCGSRPGERGGSVLLGTRRQPSEGTGDQGARMDIHWAVEGRGSVCQRESLPGVLQETWARTERVAD